MLSSMTPTLVNEGASRAMNTARAIHTRITRIHKRRRTTKRPIRSKNFSYMVSPPKR